MNTRFRYALKADASLRRRLENWAQHTAHFILLDSHEHQDPYGEYELLIAWGAKAIYSGDFEGLNAFRSQHKDWLFGHFSFDLKNQLEDLESQHPDLLNWEALQFFVPQNVVQLKAGEFVVESWQYETAEAFLNSLPADEPSDNFPPLSFKPQSQKGEYLHDLQSLKKELQYGNIYEINYCTLFEAKGPLNPLARFRELNGAHQVPFGGFYRDGDRYLLCFSPERYLRKRGTELISQPIKGTSPRHPDPVQDAEHKAHLLSSEKERAENVMIVDLVRNDLSRTAARNSVSVPELFGLYTFKAVHQMISTVRSELDETNYTPEDAIKYSFPMGSMTGAPKLSALKLIDKHEHFRRGLYSGSIGYIDPQGNFDFNVVIRSIAYHQQKQYAQVAVGSAITIHCDPESEYAECLLKAEKLIR